MDLIFTDFPTGNGFQSCAKLAIYKYQSLLYPDCAASMNYVDVFNKDHVEQNAKF